MGQIYTSRDTSPKACQREKMHRYDVRKKQNFGFSSAICAWGAGGGALEASENPFSSAKSVWGAYMAPGALLPVYSQLVDAPGAQKTAPGAQKAAPGRRSDPLLAL
ncbi:hypothetical protein A2U01_0002517 [Trifolium medium]|uniref:Uncharacterized protein n=1 Tax=Trifolium medium TaxID=97028 RepID=A0A392M390_9FABA|nr:hypothetical protein [Trifolium medium]